MSHFPIFSESRTIQDVNHTLANMLAAQYNTESSNDPSDVKIVSVEKPTASPGHAVVKVRSAAMNPIDWKMMGKAFWSRPLPFTMGYDFSGVIDGLDESDATSSFKVGDAVFAVNWGSERFQHDDEGMPIGGAFAQYILMPLSKLSKKPDDVSFEEAAAVALAGTTAYQGLFEHCKIKEGSRVLVLGGSGAVGAMAIQLAKDAGAFVATTCSGRTRPYVESLNAADVIVDYTKEKWDEMEALKGMDAILDAVGETDAFNRAKDNGVLKAGGSFASTWAPDLGLETDPSSHPPFPFVAFFMLRNSADVQDKLAAKISSKKLNVVIEKTFPFTDEGLQQMIEASMKGKSCGKTVLAVSD